MVDYSIDVSVMEYQGFYYAVLYFIQFDAELSEIIFVNLHKGKDLISSLQEERGRF